MTSKVSCEQGAENLSTEVWGVGGPYPPGCSGRGGSCSGPRVAAKPLRARVLFRAAHLLAHLGEHPLPHRESLGKRWLRQHAPTRAWGRPSALCLLTGGGSGLSLFLPSGEWLRSRFLLPRGASASVPAPALGRVLSLCSLRERSVWFAALRSGLSFAARFWARPSVMGSGFGTSGRARVGVR